MKKLLAIALAAAMLALTACGGSGTASSGAGTDGSQSGAASGDAVDYKDTLILGTASDQDIMDGQNNVTNDKILRTVYSRLVTRNENSEIVGDLAESWKVGEDNVTWTFQIKKGVKFHNGKELTAKDVKASFDRLLNDSDPQRYTGTMGTWLDHCDIVDDYTVNLVTKNPYGPCSLPSAPGPP